MVTRSITMMALVNIVVEIAGLMARLFFRNR
jgi:hypothetical protein